MSDGNNRAGTRQMTANVEAKTTKSDTIVRIYLSERKFEVLAGCKFRRQGQHDRVEQRDVGSNDCQRRL